MVKYIINLDLILYNIERSRATISTKSQFSVDRLYLTRYIYTIEGYSPNSEKVIKILD